MGVAPRFETRTVVRDGTRHPYKVFLPSRLTSAARPPVILALHGSGERGSDGERQLTVGLGPVVRARADDFPAVVVFPQAPAGRAWTGAPAEAAMSALDATMRDVHGDPHRVYLTGISMGGFGAWELASLHPNRFAALVVVCGGVLPLRLPSEEFRVVAVPEGTADPFAYLASRIGRTPVWIVHGEKDPVVPVDDSRRMAAALRAVHGTVHYEELGGVGHNAWTPAYEDDALWSWVFAQRR